MILPYAFPAFLSALVWAGMLNPDFGFVNQVLFGGAKIPWLTNEWLARGSILFVNLWMGFPYMFLVCTGALQAIPSELEEAARVDGATAWQAFRRVKFPLLLVSLVTAVFTFLPYALVPGVRDNVSTNDIAFAVAILAITWTIFWFARHSRQRGWLR